MIKLEPVLQCPLCGSLRKNIIYEKVRDRLFQAEGEWTFATCDSCGLIFLDPRPILEDIHKTYTETYSKRKPPAGKAEGGAGSRFKKALRDAFYHRFYGYQSSGSSGAGIFCYIPFLVPFLKRRLENAIFRLPFVPGGRLLDVGCGVGDFVEQMMSMGWEAEGIDIDENVVKTCRNRGLKVNMGLLEELAYPESHFDVIVLKHLIEHVPDPLALIGECKRILKPEGKLLIMTPNAWSCAHKVFGPYWLGLDVSRHLYIFSNRTLPLVVKKAGLDIVEYRTNARISKFVWLASYFNKNNDKSIYNEKPPLLFRIQASLFSLKISAKLIFNNAAGDELQLLATKQ